MSSHTRSVRARILLLVLVPVLSLFGLCIFITGIIGKDALNLARARAQKTAASEPVSNFLGQQVRVSDLRLLLFGGLGLLAVVASIIVALLVGRGLVRELSGLRRSAEDVADHRLPQMVGQLAAGGTPGPAEEPLDIKVKTTEIAQIRDAFTKVQHTAMDAAVDQARLREGIDEAFRGLARRSQSLLHRQLALLDGMERRTEDPQELADLFRIHHLTTRMRRHAESLIILSGQSPPRGWRNPVPFVDVIRAAVAEVEDYTRVSVISAGDTGLAGPAVGDVIHMIAELVENATIYSPPNTPVVIQGGIVGQGFVVEIEDRGLGMSDDKLAEVNANLAHPPPFSPTGNDQFGLLVAGQLAERYDIQITLRRNPYGGTTAIVLLPHGIVVAEGFAELEPAKALEGAPPLAYQAAPPTAAAPSAVAPPRAAAGPPPSAEVGAPGQAEAESRAWTGMESPTWSGPPQPPVNFPAWNGTNPPMLPRRLRQADPAPELADGPPAYSSLPGRFPGPHPPEETSATVSQIRRGVEQGRSIPGQADGPRQEPGVAEMDGEDPRGVSGTAP